MARCCRLDRSMATFFVASAVLLIGGAAQQGLTSSESSVSSEELLNESGGNVPVMGDLRRTTSGQDSASIEDVGRTVSGRSRRDVGGDGQPTLELQHIGVDVLDMSETDAEQFADTDDQSRTARQSSRRPYDAKSCLACVDLYLEKDANELGDLQETYSKCVLVAMDTTDLSNLLLFSPGSPTSSRAGFPGGGGGGGAGGYSSSSGKPTKTYFWLEDPDRNGRPAAEHFPSDPDFMRKSPYGALTSSTTTTTKRRKRGSRGKPSFNYSPGYPYPPSRPDPFSTLNAKIQTCFLEKSGFANTTQSGRMEPVVENVESFIDTMTGSDDAKRRMKRAATQCAGEQSRPARYNDWYECFWRKACDVCCSTPQSTDADSAGGNLRQKPNAKLRSADGDVETVLADDDEAAVVEGPTAPKAS